jgi:hypothetical protein
MTNFPAPNHPDHPHEHGPGCGYASLLHGDHVDYLHDAHHHPPDEGYVDGHVISVSSSNPDQCTSGHSCGRHEVTATAPAGATKRCRTAIMWTIVLPGTCTTRTAIAATTSGRSL